MQQLWLYWAGDADKMHWLHLMNERDWLKWCQVLPWQNNLRYYVLVAGMFCCVGSIISCSIQSSDKSVFWILIMKISTKVSWYSLAKSSLPAKFWFVNVVLQMTDLTLAQLCESWRVTWWPVEPCFVSCFYRVFHKFKHSYSFWQYVYLRFLKKWGTSLNKPYELGL